ncbi:Hypothetical_protein [Hexamita inflata]|uniref:Hypothetical_protein n=1 Tax=Hexamita inflata TaxID=28002 RepID=A0ABP1KJE8_9EUKA
MSYTIYEENQHSGFTQHSVPILDIQQIKQKQANLISSISFEKVKAPKLLNTSFVQKLIRNQTIAQLKFKNLKRYTTQLKKQQVQSDIEAMQVRETVQKLCTQNTQITKAVKQLQSENETQNALINSAKCENEILNQRIYVVENSHNDSNVQHLEMLENNKNKQSQRDYDQLHLRLQQLEEDNDATFAIIKNNFQKVAQKISLQYQTTEKLQNALSEQQILINQNFDKQGQQHQDTQGQHQDQLKTHLQQIEELTMQNEHQILKHNLTITKIQNELNALKEVKEQTKLSSNIIQNNKLDQIQTECELIQRINGIEEKVNKQNINENTINELFQQFNIIKQQQLSNVQLQQNQLEKEINNQQQITNQLLNQCKCIQDNETKKAVLYDEQITSIEKQIKQMDAKFEKQHHEHTKIKEFNTLTNQKNNQLSELSNNFVKQIEEKHNEHKDFQKQIKEYQAEANKQMQLQISKQTQEIDALKSQTYVINESIQNTLQKIEQITNTSQNITNEHKIQYTTQFKQMGNQLTKFEQNVNSFTQQFQTIDQKLNTNSKEQQTLQENLSIQNNKIDKIEQIFNEQKLEQSKLIQKLNTNIDIHTILLQELTANVETAQEGIIIGEKKDSEKLEQALASIVNQFASRYNEQNTKFTELKDKILQDLEIKANCTDLDNQIESIKKILITIQEGIICGEKQDSQKLEQTFTVLVDRVDTLYQSESQLQSRMSQLEETLQSSLFKSQFDQQLQNQLNSLVEQINESERQNSQKIEQIILSLVQRLDQNQCQPFESRAQELLQEIVQIQQESLSHNLNRFKEIETNCDQTVKQIEQLKFEQVNANESIQTLKSNINCISEGIIVSEMQDAEKIQQIILKIVQKIEPEEKKDSNNYD